MNVRLVSKIVSYVMLIEAAFMLIPLFIEIAHGERADALSFVWSILIIAIVSAGLLIISKSRLGLSGFYEREGFVATSLSWIAMSLFGALPFILSGQIPSFIDAWFETMSGFTTTGASILTDVEALSMGMLYWRSFSHWLGGMGVLVFMMAIIPAAAGRNRMGGSRSNSEIFLLRAESPGPQVEKLTPHMRSTATILYVIYIGLTLLCIIFLLTAKMPLFDAVCTAIGTAGTGGFGIRGDSIASYTPYAQNVTTVFMMLFGINFNIYYLLYLRKAGKAMRNQELHWYLGIWAAAVLIVFIDIRAMYGTAGESLRHAAFQCASVMTTTGYATTDFEQWHTGSKIVMLMLMCVGASAGSTGGGMKVSRVLLLCKSMRRSIRQSLHPNRSVVIRMDKQPVSEQTIKGVDAYLIAYAFLMVISVFAVSFDDKSITTTITSVIACFNNIGPGFDEVGATGNYAGFSVFSKLVLIADMLLGRLEIFPLLTLLSKGSWDRRL